MRKDGVEEKKSTAGEAYKKTCYEKAKAIYLDKANYIAILILIDVRDYSSTGNFGTETRFLR